MTTTLLLQSGDGELCTIVFEPLGSEYVLTGDDWIRVTLTGDGTGKIEVVHRPSSVVLWPDGWTYSDAVTRAGVRPGGLI